jgi:hypothetical protein
MYKKVAARKKRVTISVYTPQYAAREMWGYCCQHKPYETPCKERVVGLLFRIHEIARSAEFWNQLDEVELEIAYLKYQRRHARKVSL